MHKETKFQFFSLIYSIIRVEMPYFDPNFSLIALLNIIQMQYNSFKVCNSVFLIFESKIEILFYIYICRVVQLLAWLNIRTFLFPLKGNPVSMSHHSHVPPLSQSQATADQCSVFSPFSHKIGRKSCKPLSGR